MGQGESFSMGKRTATEKGSDGVVPKTIKFKAQDAYFSTTDNKKDDTLEKSQLNSSRYARNDDERQYKESYEKKKECLETEVKQLKAENERMTTSSNKQSAGSVELTKDYKKKIQSLEEEAQQQKEEKHKLWTSSSYAHNDDERQCKQSLQKKKECLETEVKQLKAENERMTTSSNKQSAGSVELIKDYKKRIQSLEEEVQQQKEEKHKLWTRLSEFGALQLTYNNPNIADMSDANRPGNLVEQISELYDNEWTDAYEYLTRTEGLQDEETVKQLLNILHTIYILCMESTRKQTDDLRNAMLSYLGLPREVTPIQSSQTTRITSSLMTWLTQNISYFKKNLSSLFIN
ncbi:hypothetical protein ACJMK2_031981 [Sinanodonta woodiana]|uniref:Mitochondria-eating protein C-terminal domain-containing protein n=1 Tax=Sinanodonta woodiana TaxID=1069815 RepID=A0ABD3X0C7_SINWO